MGFAFCTIVIVKQIYFLHHTDELGFSFHNRGVVTISDITGIGEGGRPIASQFTTGEVLANHLRQIPEITEVVDADRMQVLIHPGGRASAGVDNWDDKPAEAERINMELVDVSQEYIAFYNFKLVAGEMLTDNDPDSLVMINESAVKAFGWSDPIGKQYGHSRVKGVIKDVYSLGPTIPVQPISYSNPSGEGEIYTAKVLFKYREGMWDDAKEKIKQMIDKEYADFADSRILNSEEGYRNYLKSEQALIKLLSFVSAICILICIFGFVSLVSLSCEERRKSIAIRKINGATSGDILAIFAKEYFLLLIIGAMIAFPTAYIVMQRWLEQYVKQTSIPAWIYLSILAVMTLVIVLCVGWQVYRVSVENPAEVVKSE